MAQEVIFVVARDLNSGIGKNNALPWKLCSDLQHFKALTTGQIVVMGRKTAQSLCKPLPNRTNVVLSKSGFLADGFQVLPSIDAVLNTFPNRPLYIIGGATIYQAFLPKATQIVLTEVQAKVEADTWFTWQPKVNEWELTHQTKQTQNEKDDYPFIIKTFTRRAAPATAHL